ncbi:MAG: NYN domain-containing protein [Treponemataceae bacterium]|nr:NYN domain-containing protein [Treponemataceae bacterium]
MEIKDKIIALLIDSDNISSDYFSIILDELSQYGKVTYRRLYGDFTNPKANGWKQALLDYSIEQIQQVAFTKGKNATDSKMIIDAMDILYQGKVDCFCLATSDSDFTNLAMRFRNDNLVVIGAGEQKTPTSFRNACDRFIAIDDLLKTKVQEKEKNKEEHQANNNEIKERRSHLIDIAKDIINANAGIDGWMHLAAFMNEIYRKENDFNAKLYGYKNPSSIFKNAESDGKKVFELKLIAGAAQIKLN